MRDKLKNLRRRCAALVLTFVVAAAALGFEGNVAKAATYQTLAKDVAIDGTWSDEYWVTETDTTDQWYRIVLPSDGALNLKIMAYMSWVDAKLYNADLTTYYTSFYGFGGSEITPSTREDTMYLSAGTYYMKVDVSATSNGKYKMCATFTSYGATDGAANSYDSPQDIAANTEVVGALLETDEEDWYRLYIPTSGKYQIKVVTYMSSMNLYLWNADLTQKIAYEYLYDGKPTVPKTDFLNLTLSPGTYYIKTNTGNYGKYTLSWAALTPENCNHSYNDTTVSATYVSDGYTEHVCENCGYSYRDNYTSKLKLTTPSFYVVSKGSRKKTIYVSYSTSWAADGYQIKYSTSKSFRSGVKKVSTTSGDRVIKKLKRRRRYYVKVRAYKYVDGRKVYSSWSGRRSAKAK